MSGSQKVIVVSGCTQGIGRAICDTFAHQGFAVAGFARNENDLALMRSNYATKYPGVPFLFVKADASIKQQVLDFAQKVTNTFKTIDVLVNNAGVFLPGSIMEEPDGTLEALIETNVYSAYYLTRALKPIVSRNIFNICSIASLSAYEAGASYTISKFAMLGFSKQLRHELKQTGIKVTAVMPGAVLTNAWSGANLPSERFIPASDIGQTIYQVYTLSDSTDIEELVIRPQLGDI
jgi:NAD(P)-dependent dehydrogenase (short-subunit alcohol dehydrogenase family)